MPVGFAFAKQHRVETWNELMDKYLTSRPNLKRVYLVVDARHGLKASDREMLAFLSKPAGAVRGDSQQVRLRKPERSRATSVFDSRGASIHETRANDGSHGVHVHGCRVTEIAREIFDMAPTIPTAAAPSRRGRPIVGRRVRRRRRW